MNAIELLKEDHDRVDKLFQKVQATEESEHMDLFQQILSELEVHTQIEETIFYPTVKEKGDDELKSLRRNSHGTYLVSESLQHPSSLMSSLSHSADRMSISEFTNYFTDLLPDSHPRTQPRS